MKLHIFVYLYGEGFDNCLGIRWENTFAARVLHSPKMALSLSFSCTYCIDVIVSATI